MQWEREITTEVYQEVEEEGWKVPVNGRQIASFRAIHHYKKVSDGYVTKTRTKRVKVGEEEYVCGKRDLGNGYFEDKYCSRPVYEEREESYQEESFHREPVYRTKYRYAIFKWLPGQPIRSRGQDKSPEWGSTASIENNKSRRESGRSETYELVVRDKRGDKHKEQLSFSQWKAIEKGDRLRAKRNGMGKYKGLVW